MVMGFLHKIWVNLLFNVLKNLYISLNAQIKLLKLLTKEKHCDKITMYIRQIATKIQF